MSRPLFAIALDACDKDLVIEWVRQGHLPTFEKLFAVATIGETENARSMEAGSALPSFYFGSLPDQHGHYDGNRAFNPESYDFESHREENFRQQPIWNILARSGKKCVIVDPPYIPLPKDPNITAVMNYGQHTPVPGTDRISLVTNPPELAEEISEKFGTDPLDGFICDHYRPRSAKQLAWFRDALIQRVRGRTAIVRHLMDRQPWDFFLSVIGECHCIGHHAWHIHDPDHPEHDPAIAKELGDPMLDVYKAADQSIGELWEACKDRADFAVYLTHGIEEGFSGSRLLDRILARLDNQGQDIGGYSSRKMLRNAWAKTWRASPKPVKKALSPLRAYARDKIYARGFQPNRDKRRYFEVIVNDRTGGVRINLQGREKNGIVAPEDYDAVCDEVIADLKEIANKETGEPLVAEVTKIHELFHGPLVDRLPDVTVTWNRHKPIRVVASPKIGEITHDHPNIRSGDHRPYGMFMFAGAGIGRSRLNGRCSVTDVTHTLASLLDVDDPQFEGGVIKVRDKDAAEMRG